MMPISGKGETSLLYFFYILLDQTFFITQKFSPKTEAKKVRDCVSKLSPHQILEDLSLNYGTMSGNYGDGLGIVGIKTRSEIRDADGNSPQIMAPSSVLHWQSFP